MANKHKIWSREWWLRFLNAALNGALLWSIFGACLTLSGTFAFQLYTGLVDDLGDKNLLGTGAIVVEAIKVLALILANTAVFSATLIKSRHLQAFREGKFKQTNWDLIQDITFLAVVMRRSKLIQRAAIMFAIYGFCALITITGSFGFILTHVALRGQSVSAVTNSSVVDSNTDLINTNKATIANNQDTINQNKLTITGYRKDITDWEKTAQDTELEQKAVAQNKATLTRKIQTLLDTDTALTNKNSALATQGVALATKSTDLKKTDERVEQSVKKDMYDLMSDALGHIVRAETLRLILLSLFAIAIEIGLFFFSPHLNLAEELEEEEALENPLPPTPPTEPIKKVRNPRTSRKPKDEVKVSAPAPEAALAGPQVEPFSFPGLAVGVPVEAVVEPEAIEAEVVEVAQEVAPAVIQEVETPVEAPILEEEILPSPEELTKTVEDQRDAFIKALYQTEDGALKEFTSVAKATGTPLPIASRVFDFLVTHRTASGFKLIEYDSHRGVYYVRQTESVAMKEAQTHLPVRLLGQS